MVRNLGNENTDQWKQNWSSMFLPAFGFLSSRLSKKSAGNDDDVRGLWTNSLGGSDFTSLTRVTPAAAALIFLIACTNESIRSTQIVNTLNHMWMKPTVFHHVNEARWSHELGKRKIKCAGLCSYLAIKQCRYELAVDMCLGNLFYKKEDTHFTFNLSTSKTNILTLKRYALLYYIPTCIKLLDMLKPTYQKYYSLSTCLTYLLWFVSFSDSKVLSCPEDYSLFWFILFHCNLQLLIKTTRNQELLYNQLHEKFSASLCLMMFLC